MTPRRRRLLLVCGILVGVSISAALALTAFRQNVTFYFIPSQVAAGKVPAGEQFRLGGMVAKGSVRRTAGTLEVHFTVTDFKHDIPVAYDKTLPDLFREGQGVIAHGHLDGNGVFVADEVLAKHDEKYMPPQMAEQIKAEHGGVMPFGTAGSEEMHSHPPAPPSGNPPQVSTRTPGSS
jgi:cytochrome c-type biogenesis protein CcmE